MTIKEFVFKKHGVVLTDQQARELESRIEAAGVAPVG